MENKQPIFKAGEITHIVLEWDILKNVPLCETSKLYTGIKEATDETGKLILLNPDKKYRVFQLRTVLEGKIEIERTDYNS